MSHTAMMSVPSVHCVLPVKSPVISSVMLTTTAGSPPNSARRNTLRSCPDFSKSIHRDPAIQRAAREAERFRRLAHVPAVPLQRLLDEQTFDIFQWKILELGAGGGGGPKGEVRRANGLAMREQHGALDGVSQLADVAGPRMLQQLLHRLRVESLERL